MSKEAGLKFHYAFIICFSCMLLMYANGITDGLFSMYQPYIMEEYGITHTGMSAIQTTKSIMMFVTVLLSGLFYKKIPVRLGMGLGGLCYCGSFFLFAISKNFITFFISSLVLGIGNGIGTMIPISMILSSWFITNKKFAVSLTTVMGSVGTIGIPNLFTSIIGKMGVKTAFNINAMLGIAIVIVAFLLLRERPEDKGLKPYENHESENKGNKRKTNDKAPTKRGYLKKKDFITLGAVCFVIGVVACSPYTFLTVYMSNEGMPPQAIAFMLTVQGISVALGKLCYGFLSDKFSSYKCNKVYFLVLFLGLMTFAIGRDSVPMFLIATAITGFGSPLASVGLVSWAWDLSAPAQSDFVVRFMQSFYNAGTFIFSFIPGVIVDFVTGSYRPILLAYAFLVIPTFIAIESLYKKCSQVAG